MPGPSVTYTFANSTVADATQVNTNFTDIINGVTDGTKDLSISALTCAGNATLNGNLTVGNASADTLTVNASLASSIPVGTTFSYDIGSATIGMRSIYFGDAASNARTVRLIAPNIASSYTLTLPNATGSSREYIQSDGSGGMSWVPVRRSPSDRQNYSLATAVAASALTITLNGADGNAPSSTNPVDIVFRNATAATGTPVTRTVTSALTLTISSGSTLGHPSAVDSYIYVYALDNAGTVELAATSTRIDQGTVQSTTAEGGGGAADSFTVIYSTTARANVAFRYLGRLKSQQATAGTWATAIAEVSLYDGKDSEDINHEVWLQDPNGFGSTNTKIRRWLTTIRNVGTYITYADSATNGSSFTINRAGRYGITYQDTFTGGSLSGISLNSNQLTTNIGSITAAHILAMAYNSPTFPSLNTVTIYLVPGDVVRPHSEGAAGSGYIQMFRITYLGQ